MGGRGAYSLGKQKQFEYKNSEKVSGVKVLMPINEKSSFGMPAESHTSKAYIVLDKKKGVFRTYREYINHLPAFEIGYHFESGLSEHGENVFHIHEYTAPGIEHRQKGRLMTPEEISKYQKYFKGITQKQITVYIDYYRRHSYER